MAISGTIRDNIDISHDLSDDEIYSCLKTAELENDVNKFPMKLNTFVGENGQNISGGQKQRIAIARALASPAKVLLADEPTGNLDSASSKEILQILKSMHEQGKTVILITHDNGIAAQARRVVRIMDGKIESDFINKNYGKEEYIKNQLDA